MCGLHACMGGWAGGVQRILCLYLIFELYVCIFSMLDMILQSVAGSPLPARYSAIEITTIINITVVPN